MKMKKLLVSICLLLAVAILSGCATSGLFKGREISVPLADDKKAVLTIDQPPVMLAGIPGIPLNQWREAQEFIIPCPIDLINSEYRPARKSWNCIGLDEEGNIFPGTGILNLDEKSSKGNFYLVGKVIVSKRKGVNVLILSTRATFGYNADERGTFIDVKKLADIDYRKSLYQKGTPLADLPETRRFDLIISDWHRFATPFGLIRTPWPKETITELAKIFTGYTPGDRYGRDAVGLVSINPIAMVIAHGRDFILTLSGSTTGWDMDSKSPDWYVIQRFLWEARNKAKVKIYQKERNADDEKE
jgi:hypothetical protein